MRTPRLSRRLVLETPERVPDGAGGHVETWTPVGEIWADIRARGGRERDLGVALLSAVRVRITVRGAPPGAEARPRPEQQFREGTRLYRIEAVTEADPAARFLLCACVEEAAS